MESIRRAINECIALLDKDDYKTAADKISFTFGDFREEFKTLAVLASVLKEFDLELEKVRAGISKVNYPNASSNQFSKEDIERYAQKETMKRKLKRVLDKYVDTIGIELIKANELLIG